MSHPAEHPHQGRHSAGITGDKGASALDRVAALVRQVGHDRESLQRIAFASTLSHGESAWVTEMAWQAYTLRMHVARETNIGGIPRVDLAVNGTAIEFKATFGGWTLAEPTATERRQWLGADIDKLRHATVPAVVVVSVAALGPGVTHQQPRFKVESSHPRQAGRPPQSVLEAGVRAVTATLTEAGCLHVRHVQLPSATVNTGDVLLGAVLGAVNEAATTQEPRRAAE